MLKTGQTPTKAEAIAIPGAAVQEQTAKVQEPVFYPGRPPLMSYPADSSFRPIFTQRKRYSSESTASSVTSYPPKKITHGFDLDAVTKTIAPETNPGPSGASAAAAPALST